MLVLSSKKLAKIDEIKQAGRTGNLYSVEFSAVSPKVSLTYKAIGNDGPCTRIPLLNVKDAAKALRGLRLTSHKIPQYDIKRD